MLSTIVKITNQNRITKGGRAAATQGFLYVLKCIKQSLLNKSTDGQQKCRPVGYLALLKLLIGFPGVYASLEIRVSWTCAKKWAKKFMREDAGLKGVLAFWVAFNYVLWLFKWYLYENNITTQGVQHAYDLLRKQILPSLVSDSTPSGLMEIKRIHDTGLKNYDWQTYIASAGCLLNDSACQLLSALFCINDNDVLVFSRMLVDIDEVLYGSNKRSFQKIKHNVQVMLKRLRDWLEGYCDKMCAYTTKARDVRGVEMWNLAKQTISAIRAKTPCIENEGRIAELVAEFCKRANEAGALTCGLHMVSLDQLAYMPKDTLEECRRRIVYFKKCIENHDGYKLFAEDTDEEWVQLMFWFVWYGSEFDINRECENGRGKCDYAISCGANDKCIIEIKLGSNRSLLSGLKNQLGVYKDVNETQKGVYILVCRTQSEIKRCRKITNQCKLVEDADFYIVDATKKVTASKLK